MYQQVFPHYLHFQIISLIITNTLYINFNEIPALS